MNGNYRYHRCPTGVVSQYAVLVFNPRGKPFMPLTDFFKHEQGRISDSSAFNYLDILLPFFRWLDQFSNYQNARVVWDMEVQAIQVAVTDYLKQEMYCKVRPYETFEFVNLTVKSPNTVNRFLAALKAFYKAMIKKKMYPYPNPLIDSQAISKEAQEPLEGERKGRPRMPQVAGTEKPSPHTRRRETDNFFKILNDEWQPVIIDDPFLPSQVFEAGKKVGWTLRDEVIGRMLFETGGRATEVIEVNIGDYRARTSIREMSTFSKGSHGRRIKFLLFSDDTYTLLMKYLNTERKQHDPNGLCFDELPDEAPIFLTKRGTAYNYHAWYAHWKKAMEVAGMDVNPHKTRHWYVTRRMRMIYETSKTEQEKTAGIEGLVKYMKWRSDETLKVYEHYFNEQEQLKQIDQLHQNMKLVEEEHKAQRKRKTKSNHLPSELLKKQEIIIEDEELRDFYMGLEDE
ncbi:site-specific integrase [Aneurinibacillus sp. Ricciae_BoGa-3]|uniref:tyrosine-type recombinase/integrase n=1 Tax=Aneurinibacillus sp. Ricciae_BoGa-3 TaxID=3022697 RepID=UPI00234082F4|nr:tyrosine-type recombinase/integrase [Aneurinibacillus sp. Ricciae_BoGa-3]WCK55914.1 site-specific integrase [Aneurinibacillus sp. Ricciae_BoGa-3]